jgi:hypothetical protein
LDNRRADWAFISKSHLKPLAFVANGAVDGCLARRCGMIKFEAMNEDAERFAEIERHLKKLDLEMASPNIKEVKHAELSVLYRQLDTERQLLRKRAS